MVTTYTLDTYRSHLDLAEPVVLFLGISTAGSWAHRLFPDWTEDLSEHPRLVGLDAPVGVAPEAYRTLVSDARTHPGLRGVVVTSHKLTLYAAASGLLDEVVEPADELGEVNCIRRDPDGALTGFATDTEAGSATLASLLPADAREPTVVVFGAGGAAVALVRGVSSHAPGARVVALDIEPSRLAHLRSVSTGLPIRLETCINSEGATRALLSDLAADRDLRSEALIVNATGLGKDLAGSPVPDDAPFPYGAVVWDLNYRGNLEFLRQARRHEAQLDLRIADGWSYFLHGWRSALSAIFPDAPPAMERSVMASPRAQDLPG